MVPDEDEAEPFGRRNWIIPIIMVVFAVIAVFIGLMNRTGDSRRQTADANQLAAEQARAADAQAGFEVEANSPAVSRPVTNED
jgi:hypothetical protein